VDKILVENDKHHKNRHAVGMPHRHIMLHTYGMLLILGMFILPISHPYGMRTITNYGLFNRLVSNRLKKTIIQFLILNF
jgi:hypothetical protein